MIRILTGFLIAYCIVSFSSILATYSTYGGVIDDHEELRKLMEEEKLELNGLDSSIISPKFTLKNETDIEYVSREYFGILTYPFTPPSYYYICFGHTNRRISPSSDLHKKLEEFHKNLKKKNKGIEPEPDVKKFVKS